MGTGSAEKAIGCAAVGPGAMIGFAGLADYAGPHGWQGLSEFIGWTAVCVVAGMGVARLLSLTRCQNGWRYAGTSLAIGALGFGPYWLGLYAPMRAKTVFTTSLQLAGTASATAVICWFGWILWTQRHRY